MSKRYIPEKRCGICACVYVMEMKQNLSVPKFFIFCQIFSREVDGKCTSVFQRQKVLCEYLFTVGPCLVY